MGAVNIDNTGSGASVTLSSDGTDLLLNGSPIGGGGGASPITISNKTSAYTVVSGDLGTIINCTSGTFTVALDAAATLGSGFNCWIWNTGTGVITIDPNGAETIDGLATLVFYPGEGAQIVCDGTNWQTGDKKKMRGYSENFRSNTPHPSATGLNSVAIGYGATATSSRCYSFGFQAAATGNYTTAIGQNSGGLGSQAVSNNAAMALGGSYASGTDSFAAAIGSNSSAYGAKGTDSIAMGDRCVASSTSSVAIGDSAVSSGGWAISIGTNTTASANRSGCFAGLSTTASGTYAVTIGGTYGSAEASDSIVLGSYGVASVIGKTVFGTVGFNSVGLAQTGVSTLVSDTTDATPEALTTNNTAPGTDNQVILPNNSAYAFSGIIVARQQASGGTASAAWKIEGLIRREANAASTTLVASTVTAIDNTPGWTLALSADTTNGGLKIEATGAAATNIRWVATVQTSEVTYA